MPRSVFGITAAFYSGGDATCKGSGIGWATADFESGEADMRGRKRSGSSGRECRHCVLRSRDALRPVAWQGGLAQDARRPIGSFPGDSEAMTVSSSRKGIGTTSCHLSKTTLTGLLALNPREGPLGLAKINVPYNNLASLPLRIIRYFVG